MPSKNSTFIEKRSQLTFQQLVASIEKVHTHFAAYASKSVNVALTLRNWAIGFYIREYEQKGADRAQYGQELLPKISQQLKKTGALDYHFRELRRCRLFYEIYPQIGGTLSPQFKSILPIVPAKRDVIPKIGGTASPEFGVSAQTLITHLSFSHFAELLEVEDPLKRAFYEMESITGQWSVRDLKRQIASLYFERTGLSKNKRKLAALTKKGIEGLENKLNIRDPYIFEFLGIKSSDAMSESDLEKSLLGKLQDFLLELGHGFCFEASQKRILIDGKHYFVDLVFYHRILRCHVLLELKVDEFNHEHLGQLNTYVSWYDKNIKENDDNPPIGILLCTKKDHALAEYALAGMNNKLFVSKYQVELPKKRQMEKFLETSLKEIE
jgi:predicted nuclease of restriction endonuclease-like (RecB) superfamily